jgi:PAS domain S-box-containing protein
MKILDIFLQGLKETNSKQELKKITPSKILTHPLMCWDIISTGIFRHSKQFDIQQFQKLAAKHKWNIDLSVIHETSFDALVVTDLEENIIWVSNGFKEMTGYSPSFALRKKPNFLQGSKTSVVAKNQIRTAINHREHIEATLINYRKDGSEYNCRIEIFPLYTDSRRPTHFLAVEQAI